MRTPEQLLKAYDTATKDKPLILSGNETDNFSKAMKMASAKEDARIRQYNGNSIKTVIMDKDKLLANGILSPLTQEPFHNRRDYADHLKRHGCVEVGNDLNNAREIPGKLRGDFDVRADLARATYEVAEKHGY